MEPFHVLNRVIFMAIIKLWPKRQSEHEQFEQLVGPYLQQLYRLAWRFTGQQTDAEDLVQDVIVKLYPHLAELKEIEQLGPWLSKVLYRHFIDGARSRQRSPLQLAGDDPVYESHSDESADPSRETENELLQGRLQQAMTRLNEDQRLLMILHDVEGYTLGEIQGMLDVPTGTLKSRLSRARERLRDELKNMEPFAADKRVNG
jgi:RNA polymerase sigma-70 factor (ECF subfamily)